MATSSSSTRPPASLKGITSSNVDPDACAVCSSTLPAGPLTAGTSSISVCCGKRSCMDCDRAKRYFVGRGRCPSAVRCLFCNVPVALNDKNRTGSLKKHAKKGRAWGQFLLGLRFARGNSVSQSDYEAKRWFEKASKQGHPDATLNLGVCHLDGRGGCSVDLYKAREFFEKAMTLDSHLADRCHGFLFRIAQRVDSPETKKSILISLANEGYAEAQNNLGRVLMKENDRSNAKAWLVAAALQGDGFSARNILVYCKDLLDMPEAHFWLNIVLRSEEKKDDAVIQKSIEAITANLRKLRDSCGGCGADLVGDRRKYCKQCRTYCYCSHECQKLHWNRTGEGGHRSECMGAKLLEDKMATANSLPRSAGE
mmetsp:Transcript_32227/g.70839  ORF Transcript_32227/g.70839 Transcript_32227/m.70839 type:complete len:368 (-) Transcript_32227:353-1456(-)